MSTAIDLIENLSSRGVEFVLVSGKIRFRGSRSVLTSQHIETLKEHRGEVVEFLLSRADFPHGQAVCGRPKTWTGKVVSLDEWRLLSEWEKHGSTGKVWNGLTRKWEPAP